MDVAGPIPFLAAHAARLYGAGQRRPVATPTAATTASTGPATSTATDRLQLSGRAPDMAAGAASPTDASATTSPAAPAARRNPLVAGRLATDVDPFAPLATGTADPAAPASAGPSRAAMNAYAMYSRPADRVEVATSVAIGRAIYRTA